MIQEGQNMGTDKPGSTAHFFRIGSLLLSGLFCSCVLSSVVVTPAIAVPPEDGPAKDLKPVPFVFWPNERGILDLMYSPADDRFLTCGSDDRGVQVWDAKTGKLLFTITDTEDPGHLKRPIFSSNGKTIAAMSFSGKVGLWDAKSGKRLRFFPFDPDGDGTRLFALHHCSLAVSPDGRRLAISVGEDPRKAGQPAEVGIFNPETGTRLLTLNRHRRYVLALAYSPDSRLLATASLDNTCRIWDASTGKLLRTFRGHEESVFSLVFAPSGKWLASGDRNGVVILWDPSTGKTIRTLQTHESVVDGLAVNPQGTILVTTGRENTLVIWDVATGRALGRCQGDKESFDHVTISPDGKSLLAIYGKSVVQLPLVDGAK